MTIKEIIDGLKFTVDMFLFDPSTGETYTEPRNDMDKTTIDACKGAIELLEQEPCDDCVSRQAVLEYIEGSWAELGHSSENELVCQDIKEMPPVTPQQKTGYWILTDVEGNRVWHCNCSECGKDPQDYIGGSENWWLIKNKLPKYCPNCGAKMESDIHCNYTDAEIAKSFIEDIEAVKDLLPRTESEE